MVAAVALVTLVFCDAVETAIVLLRVGGIARGGRTQGNSGGN